MLIGKPADNVLTKKMLLFSGVMSQRGPNETGQMY